MSHQVSFVLFFLILFTISSCQTSYADFDLVYNDTAACQNLCTRDIKICTDWIGPITEDPLDPPIDVSACYSTVATHCTDKCSTDPSFVVSCSRCAAYETDLCPTENGQEYCDFALIGCYKECNCLEACRQDFVFCERYMNYWLGTFQCETMMAATCFIPCMSESMLPSPQRQQLYMQYCYDTFATFATCSEFQWPEYVPA